MSINNLFYSFLTIISKNHVFTKNKNFKINLR